MMIAEAAIEGRVAEWFKALDSKSNVVKSYRGFKSHPFRQTSFSAILLS